MKKVDFTLAFIVAFILITDSIYEFYLLTGRGFNWYQENYEYILMYLLSFLVIFLSMLFIIKVSRNSHKYIKYVFGIIFLGIFFNFYVISYGMLPTISKPISEAIITTALIALIYSSFKYLISKFKKEY